MTNDSVFDWACGALESATSLDRLEARGTLRLALKASGLEARDVTAEQLHAVILRVLPPELEARGVADAGTVCETMARDLNHQGFQAAGGDSPENIFARLGGG